MNNNIIILLIAFSVCFLSTIRSLAFVNCSDSTVSSKVYTDKFKILKIKSGKGIYTIYAERNDTLFKIVTKKEKNRCCKWEKIQKNREYFLSLETLFPRYIGKTKCPPPGATGRTTTYFGGTYVEIEKNIWDIFKATNLDGLYIIEELEKSSINLFDAPF